jgi:hypothetical protein
VVEHVEERAASYLGRSRGFEGGSWVAVPEAKDDLGCDLVDIAEMIEEEELFRFRKDERVPGAWLARKRRSRRPRSVIWLPAPTKPTL